MNLKYYKEKDSHEIYELQPLIEKIKSESAAHNLNEIINYIDIDDLNFIAYGEDLDSHMENTLSSEPVFYISTHKGHNVILYVDDYYTEIYTPFGKSPLELPDYSENLGKIANLINKNYNKDELAPRAFAGSFFAHGTSMDSGENILKKGIDHEYTALGNMGKGFYCTSNLNYANQSYGLFENNDNGCVVIVKIHLDAKVIDGSHPLAIELINNFHSCKLPEIARQLDVDALYLREFDALCIYNPKIATAIGYYDCSLFQKEINDLNNVHSLESH